MAKLCQRIDHMTHEGGNTSFRDNEEEEGMIHSEFRTHTHGRNSHSSCCCCLCSCLIHLNYSLMYYTRDVQLFLFGDARWLKIVSRPIADSGFFTFWLSPPPSLNLGRCSSTLFDSYLLLSKSSLKCEKW